jgi:multidrug efflux pump subunit AcrB
LTLLTGVTGVFFRSLALTMAVALLTSLVLALLFTPVLAERFVKAKPGEDFDTEDEVPHGRVLGAIIRRYESVLSVALDRRWIVGLTIVLVLAGSYALYHALGSEFLPEFDESAFILDYLAPPGSSLAETDRLLQQVEALLMKTPEVESYSRRTGLEMGLFVTEPNTGDIAVKLKPDHKRSTQEVIASLREEIAQSVPTLDVEFVGIVPDVIGDLQGNPEPIEVKLFSEDAAALQSAADEVETAIKKVPGVVDTLNGIVISGPAVTFRIDPLRASQFGVTANDVATTITTAMSGDAASSILQQDRLIKVRVIFPANVRTSLDNVKALQVRSSSGQLFRLDQVADIDIDKGQAEIERENLRQMIAVTGRLEGSDLGTAIRQIREQLAKDVKMPPGMSVEFGGLYEEQQSSFRELMTALVLAVMLVFITLLIEFRSFAHPIAIVTGAVLALSGVLLALFITGSTLNVVSLMGMIMIVGIVAKNGILMLDAIEERITLGDSLREALVRSGRRRFRPVLMTSLAAMLGMLPLALAIGAGSELLQPLAIAVIGGLTMALALSLIVTPTVYAILSHEKAQADT